ncbi:hypothetical protein QQ045_027578 [Rhodiola kirilowii]
MTDKSNSDLMPKLGILLIGIGSAALVVAVYHSIAMGWCTWRTSRRRLRWSNQGGGQQPSFESSVIELLPIHKYQKGMKSVNDATCAVCLCDFEDGEELRSLPECLHSFHVECIDMWLYTHLNCPVCRADATPSPSPFRLQQAQVTNTGL